MQLSPTRRPRYLSNRVTCSTQQFKRRAPSSTLHPHPPDQGSSMVRCRRRRWFLATADACSEMPVLAASLTIATSFLPCGGERHSAAQRSSRAQLHASV